MPFGTAEHRPHPGQGQELGHQPPLPGQQQVAVVRRQIQVAAAGHLQLAEKALRAAELKLHLDPGLLLIVAHRGLDGDLEAGGAVEG